MRGLRGQHVQSLFHDLAEAKIEMLDIELAGLDLRKVENLVDHGQQQIGRAAADRGITLLLRRIGRFQHQVEHADHAVEGRAKLVAHVGQEFALRAISRFGGLFLRNRASDCMRR